MEHPGFNEIYLKYYRSSFLFVKSYVRNEPDAEDIASEGLIQLWQTLQKEEVHNIQALLVTILKNKSLNYLRHREVRNSAVDSLSTIMQHDLSYRINSLDACDPQEMFSSEIQEIVERTLSSLPEQTRKVFEMSRLEGKSVKDIAEILSITPKTVEYHITKSLKQLRVALKEYFPVIFFLFPMNW